LLLTNGNTLCIRQTSLRPLVRNQLHLTWRGWEKVRLGWMDRALGGTGLRILLQMRVVLIPAIIEGPIMHPNVSGTVESHHSYCKCYIFCMRSWNLKVSWNHARYLYSNYSCRYHVPRSWLRPEGNTLVLFEETGGNPKQISFAIRQIESASSHKSASPLPHVELWISDAESWRKVWRVLLIRWSLPLNLLVLEHLIFKHGNCSSNKALSVVQKVLSCFQGASSNRAALDEAIVELDYQGDPCEGVTKSLAVEASCA